MESSELVLIIVAIIAAVPPTLVAFLSLLQTKKVHYLINSRMSQLLEITKSSSRAEGKIEGREEFAKRNKISRLKTK